MTVRTIIDSLGGIRSLASKLGHLNHTTVQGWWERDVIPARRQAEVLAAAKKHNIDITPADLIPTLPERGE